MSKFEAEPPVVRVAGFGACMIGGYPHGHDGFFEVACRETEQRSKVRVQSRLCSLGGFPAPRAARYLKSRIFDFRPDYLVIQLAGLDALCPVRKPGDASRDGKGGLGAKKNPSQLLPASLWSHARWTAAALLSLMQGVEPITPLDLYCETIASIVDACIEVGIRPVILTPFVYGSRISMRSGLRFAQALRELLAKRAGAALLVDCIAPLSRQRKRQILQHDGFHLSLAGHAIVGEAIAQSICEDLQGSGAGMVPPQDSQPPLAASSVPSREAPPVLA